MGWGARPQITIRPPQVFGVGANHVPAKPPTLPTRTAFPKQWALQCVGCGASSKASGEIGQCPYCGGYQNAPR